MKTEIVHTLTHTFEAHAQQAENGIEFWLARDLQHLLGYDEWRNFTAVIIKAKTACELSGHPVSDHFVDVNKMVDLGSAVASGNRRQGIADLRLMQRLAEMNCRRAALGPNAGDCATPAFTKPPPLTPPPVIASAAKQSRLPARSTADETLKKQSHKAVKQLPIAPGISSSHKGSRGHFRMNTAGLRSRTVTSINKNSAHSAL